MGNKFKALMDFMLGTPNGPASLGADGKLADAQIPGLDKLGAAPEPFVWDVSIDTPGWYRLGAFSKDTQHSGGLRLGIGGMYSNNPPTNCIVEISSGYSPGITTIARSVNVIQITKVRLTTINHERFFVDVYYAPSKRNSVRICGHIEYGWFDYQEISSVAESVESESVIAEADLTEWENPPMQLGVEYRTTERITEKVVYKRNNGGVIEYRLDGETGWKPYASAVGAVNKAGDTMTGGLRIKKTEPTLKLYDPNIDSSAVLTLTDRILHIITYNTESTYNNSREITIAPSNAEADLVNAIQLSDVVNGSKQNYNILHTGNKPAGSYTGNGSATARTIDIGGIGNAVLIQNNEKHVIAIVGLGGAFGRVGEEVVHIDSSHVAYQNGKLTIISSNALLNENGVTYQYQVL